MSEECCIIFTTTNDKETAILIARELIKSGLAACVQLDKVRSFFKYEGDCQDEEEFRLVIKARSDNYSMIEKSIKLNHNYQLPQIIKLNFTDGLPAYLDWVRGN